MPNAINPAGETESWQSRTLTLLGEEAAARLASARVAVVGVGGVGGYAAEMLVRSGVGHITIIDSDAVAPSNINRQIIALQSTVGQAKTDLFAARFADINPAISLDARREFLTAESAAALAAEPFDFILDCIDTVAPKVALIAESMRRGRRIISSMGAGGRTDASKVVCTDLWQTREDGLARAVRQRLKALGLKRKLPVVASTESPRRQSIIEINTQNKRSSLGTLACVPAVFGIFMASYALNRLAAQISTHHA